MPALMGGALFGDPADMGYALALMALPVAPLAWMCLRAGGADWRRLAAVRGRPARLPFASARGAAGVGLCGFLSAFGLSVFG